jgi:hypothetical protein
MKRDRKRTKTGKVGQPGKGTYQQVVKYGMQPKDLHWYDTEITDNAMLEQTTSNGNGSQLIFNPELGDGPDKRTGRTVRIRKVIVKALVEPAAIPLTAIVTWRPVRFYLVVAKHNAGLSTLSANNVLDAANNGTTLDVNSNQLALRNLNLSKEYYVLKEWETPLTVQPVHSGSDLFTYPHYKEVSQVVNCNIEVNWSAGSGTYPRTAGLYLLWTCATPYSASTPEIGMFAKARVRFEDVHG